MSHQSGGPTWKRLRHQAGQWVRAATNLHRPGAEPDVLLFSTPRGGSTWLFELIGTQPGFKSCNEPLNLRTWSVPPALGIDSWATLYDERQQDTLLRYFEKLHRGELRHMNRNPWESNYRALTRRTVFKVLHGAEYMAPRLAAQIGARVVVLLRHPIAVGLSRTVLPRLDAFLTSTPRDQYAPEVCREMDRIAETGSALQKSTLSWCLQTAPLLKAARDEWAVVTYEQMVVDGSPVIEHVAHRLELPDPGSMFARLSRASTSIRGMSTKATKDVLERKASPARSLWLVEKWRDKVTLEQERAAMSVLDLMGIDAYAVDDVFPSSRYWIDPRDKSEPRT